MYDYILITPAKNEANNLPPVLASIISQTIVPKIWMIIDDGSTDTTPIILQEFQEKYSWIKSIRLPPHPWDISFHYSYVCNTGFQSIIDYCTENSIIYQYIGLLDADTEVNYDYFEKLLDIMHNDTSLGIVSGGIYHYIDGSLHWNDSNENLPAGTGRLWRKECFLNTGGYLVEPSPDSLSNVKAILRGWKIKKFKNIIAVERRMTGSAQGSWLGAEIDGGTAYYLNLHPLLVGLNIFYRFVKPPYYTGIAFGYAYLSALFKQDKKINDEEIKYYYWHTRIREYVTHLTNFK